MENRQKDFDICLFVIGIEYASHTDVSVTIQYGSILLRKGDKIVELVGSLRSDKIKEILIPKSVNNLELNLLKVWIPYSLINNSDLISDYLDYIFKPLANPKATATISLPRKTVSILNKSKEIFLDRYFCIQESKKFQLFHLIRNRNKYEFKIIVDDSEPFSRIVDIQIRDGKGNEDL